MKYQTKYLTLNGDTVQILYIYNRIRFLWKIPIWRTFCLALAQHRKQQETCLLKDFNVEQEFPEIKEIWPKLIEASQFYTVRISVFYSQQQKAAYKPL